MIWQNPFAWLGLAAIALPILIHLLGRGRARVQRFPTLRFLEASRLLPTRRTRVHDLLLLAIRVGMVAAAAAALAQPLLLTANRRHALGDPLARAIIVDTSASMQRGSAAAGRIAAQLRDSASAGVVLESADPAGAIAGAAAWLLTQPSRGEIDVVSDFQTGTLDPRDLAAVAPRIGIRLSRVDVAHPGVAETRSRVGDAEVLATATVLADRTGAQWVSSTVAGVRDNHLELLAGDNERARLAAAEHAAAALGVSLPTDTTRTITIVYPQYSGRSQLLRGAASPKAPWMTTFLARLRSDPLLVDAASNAAPATTSDSALGVTFARTSAGVPVAIATQTSEQGRDRLVLVSFVDAGSFASAALIAAATRAQSLAADAAELDASTIPDNVLASWQRAPSSFAPSQSNGSEGASDGRWLWLLALLLLVVETWVRRSPRPVESAAAVRRPSTADHSRVA